MVVCENIHHHVHIQKSFTPLQKTFHSIISTKADVHLHSQCPLAVLRKPNVRCAAGECVGADCIKTLNYFIEKHCHCYSRRLLNDELHVMH